MSADTKDRKKTTVTVSKEMHQELKKIAEKDGKKLERVVDDTLKKGLDKK